MTATKKIALATNLITATTGPIGIDQLDEVQICRDESCAIIEIHAAHEPSRSARGAPPKHCPDCRTPIPRGQGAHCTECGWDRRGTRFAEAKRKGDSNA